MKKKRAMTDRIQCNPHPDAAPPKREWQGLTVNEAREFYESDLSREDLIYKIDEFLEEKNT